MTYRIVIIGIVAATLFAASAVPTSAQDAKAGLQAKIAGGLTSAGVYGRVYHKNSMEQIYDLFDSLGFDQVQRNRVIWRAGGDKGVTDLMAQAVKAGGKAGGAKLLADNKIDPENLLRAICIECVTDPDRKGAQGAINRLKQNKLTDEMINDTLDLPYTEWALGDKPKGALTGDITKIDGVDVLRLWGTPRQRGYAYGRLMCFSIMAMINKHLLSENVDGSLRDISYDGITDLQYMRFDFDETTLEEAKGMLQGMLDLLSDDERKLYKYKRGVKLADILALQTTGEWVGMGCSTLAIGPGNSKLIGHNSDLVYDENGEILKRPIWLVIFPDKKTEKGLQPYAALVAPGQLAGYCAFNKAGGFAMVQDGDGDNTDKVCCRVRTQLIRRVLEKNNNAQKLADEMNAALAGQRFRRGAIVVAGGKRGRTVVFEADGDLRDNKGVEFRLSSPEAGKNGLSATNHFVTRKREERDAAIEKARAAKAYDPPAWYEFSNTRLTALNDAAAGDKNVDTVDGMFAALKTAELLARDNSATMHAYVIEPEENRVHVKIARDRTGGAHTQAASTVSFERLFTPREEK
ncbi:MAG: hypothetical protein IT462_07670 [Planctomycetes bacterium]|nr:hypothetical protein [Planctomycetota bacterium]